MLTDYLFVYGTLKRGGRYHRLLATAEFVAVARTEPKYRLIDCGPYPALIASDAWPDRTERPLEIVGELYRIPETLLPAIDELEDEGTLYRRATISVLPTTGEPPSSPVTAWSYLWLGRLDRFPLVAGSEWKLK